MEPRVVPKRKQELFQPGTILKKDGYIRILHYQRLPEQNRRNLLEIFNALNVDPEQAIAEFGDDIEFAEGDLPIPDIGRAVKTGVLDLDKIRQKYQRVPIDFDTLLEKAKRFADFLEENTDRIREALKHYETHNVVLDEIRRSAEHLRNLDKNREYFEYQAPAIATFMPLNQPLYALVCFGIVPAMMCKEAHIRPPTFAHQTFRALEEVLNLEEWFNNAHITYEDRDDFVNRTKKFVEGVIFIGSPENTAKVRRLYPSEILFLANGSGHNPVVIGKGADIDAAVKSVMNVTLYNQGQDCCGPNTILVDQSVSDEFMKCLLERIKGVEHLVGSSEDDRNIVGPNTDRTHTITIAEAFVRAARHHIYGGDLNPATGLIRPTVFLKPLSEGANYDEFFAPVFHVQPYKDEDELRRYFLTDEYRRNAMYITVYGEFGLVGELIEAGLHEEGNIIIESDLHVHEQGFKPYGGLGIDASCIYFQGRRKPSGILPQREIHTYLIQKTKIEGGDDEQPQPQ
nr:aldehyde dehydrogenase family protein [Cytophagales bacterium]